MTIDMTFEAREEIIRREEREQGIAEGKAEGRVEGKAEGKVEGRAEGLEQGILTSLRNLMTNLKLSAEEAIKTLSIAPEDNEKYLSMLNRKEV